MSLKARSNSRFKGSDLFIVDNSDSDWKVRKYLYDWTEIATAFDIATAYFEIGAFLALDGRWQKLDKIRILMGDEVSKRTKEALIAGVKQIGQALDNSLEREKETNDFLLGVPAIISALKKGQIECRVYTKAKFHAKAYITHARQEVVGSIALVGSSNFTVPGVTDNVELNVQVRREVDILQDWYERHWNEASDITPEILRVIERHAREYSPFEVYAKALQEYFKRHEISIGEWELLGPEKGGSRVFPILDRYQREGYQALIKIAEKYRGAFLCDGVGLGKTFVGLMVIERLLHEGKRVALFVTKSARESVWLAEIRRYLPDVGGDFSNLAIFNHTDLLRGGDFQGRLERVKEVADAIVIDEAHHFRNPSKSYRRLYDIVAGKQLYLLTATPINNRLIDLQHMIELFSQKQSDYFKSAPLGIHSLAGHFRTLEKSLERIIRGSEVPEVPVLTETNLSEAEQVLLNDQLFRALVVQRSRAYVKKSQSQQGEKYAIFPKRENPRVVPYSLEKTYGRLIGKIENAFSKKKPLFSLAIYYPLAYYKGPDTSIDPLEEGRQQQVVSLIRIQFLKRFESSVKAFEMSCETMFLKLLAFVVKNSQTAVEKKILDRWVAQHSELVELIKSHQYEYLGEEPEEEEDIIPQEFLLEVEELSRI
jgi:hypothetical protein